MQKPRLIRRLDAFGGARGSLNPQRIGVPVILPAQFGKKHIASRLGAAQIERYDEFCLIACDTGVSSGIGDSARAFVTRYDDDGVRPGFAEARKDQIDMEQGRRKIEWRFWRLLFGSSKGSIVGEIERTIDSGGCLLAGRWIRGDGILVVPVFRNDKPDNETRSAQNYDGSDARRRRAADSDC